MLKVIDKCENRPPASSRAVPLGGCYRADGSSMARLMALAMAW